MRIGELAALVGVSTRAVRHYHHVGLVPEPERLSNGYRDYRLRDAVALARVRRLAELGLPLEEIRGVLSDDPGRELRAALLELDAGLARQQEAIAAGRRRLAALLAQEDLRPDATVSAELAAVLPEPPAGGSGFAAVDRELITVIDAGIGPGDRARFADLFRPLAEPGAVARGHALQAGLDELAGADPGDPRVAAVAGEWAAYLPDAMASALVASLDDPAAGGWLGAMSRELSAAQAEVFRLLVAALKGRTAARTLPFDRPGPLEPPPEYAELRRDAPVAPVNTPDGRRAWLVTSYDSVGAVLSDPRFAMAPPGSDSSDNHTLFQDGEAHTRLRRLVSKAFTPRRIAGLRPRIERLATEHVAALAAAGPPADLVAGLAAPLPILVIGDLLGVALDDSERFRTLADAVTSLDLLTPSDPAPGAPAADGKGPGDPAPGTSAADGKEPGGAAIGGGAERGDPGAAVAWQAWTDLTGYVAGLVAAKRESPGDDLLSALIAVRDADDGRLGDDELVGLASTLVTAGYLTTRNAIAAGTILLVTQGRLADVPEQVEPIVEEVLRLVAGAIAEAFPRWALEDLDLAGVRVTAGDLVLARLEAANHDPRHLADPEGFRPGRRSARPHLTFGRGPHHCLGAALARVELGAAFRALARQLPCLRLATPAEDLTWARGQTDAGPAAVPIVW